MSNWLVGTIVAVFVAAAFALCFQAFSAANPPGIGEFRGAGGHRASGHVEIVRDGDISKVVFKDDFTLQNAPAPRLAWGKDGYKRGTIFATLAKFKGAQEYVVPAGNDLSEFNEFWIWCEKFDVPLAVAKIR